MKAIDRQEDQQREITSDHTNRAHFVLAEPEHKSVLPPID
jgi:hypothetical protein